jgi:hypothetical protein
VNPSDPPVSDLEAKGPTGHRNPSVGPLPVQPAQPAMSTLTLSEDRSRQGLTKRKGIKTMSLIRQMEQMGDRWR